MTGTQRQSVMAALLLALALAASPAVQSVISGYSDTTSVLKGKGREPLLVEFNGTLYNIYQFRTELKDVGIDMPGRRSDIYVNAFNGSNWTGPVSLTPETKDVNGHGVHTPWASVYKGKLYVTMEAVEPSLKDDDAQNDYDILLRVFDGASWDPPLDKPARVISERNDVNVSDTECRSITFRNTLHFIWDQIPVDVEAGNTTLANMRQMVFRTFDGTGWGPITVAARENSSIFSVPSVAVFNDRLWLSFQSNSSEGADVDILATSFDGSAWTPLQTVNPTIAGSPVKRQNMNSHLDVYNGRLWCVWQSADPIAKNGKDYDILASSTDGVTGWTSPAEVNPSSDSDTGSLTAQDITPDLEPSGGKLYFAWASNSTRINDGGEDFDIMLRSFDGANWSDIEQVSPYGDNGTIGGDHNVGDDNTPFLGSWNGSLYCTWITYDQAGVGHKGGNPSVIVKRAAGPAPGDGGTEEPPVGTSTDEPPGGFPWPAVAVVLLALAAGLVIVLPRLRRGGDRTEKPNNGKDKD